MNHKTLLKSVPAPGVICALVLALGSCSSATRTPEKGPPSPPTVVQVSANTIREQYQKAAAVGPHAVQFLATDLFLKANDLSVRGEAKAAAFLFGQMVSILPGDDYLKRRYAVELVKTGDFKTARPLVQHMFQQALNQNGGEDKKLGLILAGIHTFRGEWDEARTVYRKLLKKYPGNSGLCIPLANLHQKQKNYRRAEAVLGQCQRQNQNGESDRAIFPYHRGKLAFAQGKNQTALKHFSRALEQRPDFLPAVVAKTMVLTQQNRPQAAITAYRKFLKHTPNHPLVLAQLIQLIQKHSSLEDIIPYLEKLSNVESDDLNLKVQLGMLYTKYRHWEEAKRTFREILLAAPHSNRIHYNLGLIYQQTGEHQRAIDAFARIGPDSPLSYDSKIQTARALEQLVQRRSPASLGPPAQNLERAIHILQQLQDRGKLEEGHQYYLATLYEQRADYRASRELIGKMLEKNPHNPHALNFLGYSLLETGEDLQRGHSLILQALALEPEDGHIRDSLGWYYYKVGDYQKALAEIRRAYQLVPKDAVITKHLAMAYRQLGQYNKAKQYFKEALEYCRSSSERKHILQALAELSPATPAPGPH